MIPISDSPTTPAWIAGCKATWGNNGSAKRRNPYVPIFRSTPARITEPAVGASTWASGSQVWNGNIGTLMANARKNAPNSQNAAGPRPPRCATRYEYEKEYNPVRSATRYTSPRIATSISSDPKNV